VRKLEQDAAERLVLADCVPVLPIDVELSLDELTWSLIDVIAKLEPYGEGNRRPVFMTRNVQILSSDKMGSTQKHVRCLVKDAKNQTMKFVGFNFAERFDLFSVGNKIDVAYDVGVNEWNGRKEIQCKLVDVRASSAE
jgi:single-stranded-DNA-specific exonuclease